MRSYQNNHYGRRNRVLSGLMMMSVAVLMLGGTTMSVVAQNVAARVETPAPAPTEDNFLTLIAQEGEWSKILTEKAVPASLSGIELDLLTKTQWKQLRKQQIEGLRSDDQHTRNVAMQNVIYLSHFYGEKARMSKACTPLLNVYMFSRDDQARIMALAGLHAIDNPHGMATLSQRVRLEGSPRVRRLTVAALADYYKVGQVIVEKPESIRN